MPLAQDCCVRARVNDLDELLYLFRASRDYCDSHSLNMVAYIHRQVQLGDRSSQAPTVLGRLPSMRLVVAE
jgi:hypothetical protein